MAQALEAQVAHCISVSEFLRTPASKRGRIVVAEDKDVQKYIRDELAVDRRPIVVWNSTFDAVQLAEFKRWREEWSDGDPTDGLERKARRLLDRNKLRKFAVFGTLVATSEAAKLIPRRFGAQANTVYQSHPKADDDYLPVGGFYRETVEERCHEALKLLMSLGATRIKASFDDRSLSQIEVDVSASVLRQSRSVSGTGNRAHDVSGSISVELPNNDSFEMPEGLRWFDDEPSWRTMADARLRHGATAYGCRINVHESHGVNAKLVEAMKGAHLEAGGSFDRITDTTIEFRAEFPPRVE